MLNDPSGVAWFEPRARMTSKAFRYEPHRQNQLTQPHRRKHWEYYLVAEEWHRPDRNTNPQCLRNHPEKYSGSYLSRMRGSIYEEPRRIREWSLHNEVHHSTTDHLNDYENANNATSTVRSFHICDLLNVMA